MFIDTYSQVHRDLSRNNRREVVKLSLSILSKFENKEKFTKAENDLIKKIDNFILRSHYEDDMVPTRIEILEWCSKSYESKLHMTAAQNFVKDATKQSASEKSQLKFMELRGFPMEKMSASGTNSLRFDNNSNSLVIVKIEGETSRSFDYMRKYMGITEYFFGKVCFSQGGHQNSVKSELVNFLKSANDFLKNIPSPNLVFTALVDGDSLTPENLKDYQKYTSKNVRLMNCDNYLPYKS